MLRTPYEIPEDVPNLIRESPGYFRNVPRDTMKSAGIFGDDVESIKDPDWLPAGLGKARAEQLRLSFEPPADDDPVISLAELNPTYRELHVMQKYITAYDRTRPVRIRVYRVENRYSCIGSDCVNRGPWMDCLERAGSALSAAD